VDKGKVNFFLIKFLYIFEIPIEQNY